MQDMKQKAIAKITEELESFKGGNKEQAVKGDVAAALWRFAGQNEEFAQAIVQSGKTLSDCCAKAMNGVGGSISDLEVYRRAVAFYFPGAGVRCWMTVELNPADQEAGDGAPAAEKPKGGIILDLADFL